MKIQKGLVKDQGFADTTCTYGVCDDGNVYYFIENGILSNENIIASTDLKEAIGHTKEYAFLGLINKDGNVLIDFNNKNIKVVNDNYLLVEKTKPVSENVISAMGERSDPLSANKLVTTAANIKDRINAKIGRDGKYLFNNQFSEASIFDINGNQLINDYFSYIAMDDERFYFSKNIIDSEIVEYQFNNFNNSEVTNNVVSNDLDVTSTGVDTDIVNNEFDNNIPDINNFDNTVDNVNVVSDLGQVVQNESVDYSNNEQNVNEEVDNNNEGFDDIKDFSYKFEEPDTVIENANNVLKELIKQNKNQKDIIREQDLKIESLENDNNSLVEQCDKLTEAKDELDRKVNRYESIIEKYTRKLNSLSDKIDEQSQTIKDQQKRLDILEPQIAGRAQLGDTLEEAMEVLNAEDMDFDRVYTKNYID